MRLILLMMLTGALAFDLSNANGRLETIVENQKVADEMSPTTFLIDGKFTVQLFVSIKPIEEETVRRRTGFPNRRRPNRKGMSSKFKEEFTLQLADQEAILPLQVTNKNRTENDDQLKSTTVRPSYLKNRFNRMPTTRNPISRYSEEGDLPWESRKTKNATVKGSVNDVLNRTRISPPNSRPQFSRIRTTTTRRPVSKESKETHFVVEQKYANSANKSRAGRNQTKDLTVTVNDTITKFQEAKKEVETISLGTAPSQKVKNEQVQSDNAHNSDLIGSIRDGHLNEKPQAEAPIFIQSIAGHGSSVEQATSTTEIVPIPTVRVAFKLPLPLSRRQPIAIEPAASDIITESDTQVFIVWETLTPQIVRDSTATGNPIPKYLRNVELLDGGYVIEQEKSITSDTVTKYREENKEADSYALSNNKETTMTVDDVHSANASNDSVLSRSANEDQLEEIPKFDEPIFRHSLADRGITGELSPVGDFPTFMVDVALIQSTTPAAKFPMSLNHSNPIAKKSDDLNGSMTEPTINLFPITEILTIEVAQEQMTATHDPVSSSEDPSSFPWKQIGDIEVQMNPKTKEVINIRSQTTGGVHFIMATSHIPISLYSEEFPEFPWERLGDFEVQIDPQARQVVNIRTQIVTNKHTEIRTHNPPSSSEQSSESSREQQSVHHHPNFNPHVGQVQSATDVLVNKAKTPTAIPVETTTNSNPTQQKSDYETRISPVTDKEVNLRTEITISTPYWTSMNEKQEDADPPAVGLTHTDMIAVELPIPTNRRKPNVNESVKLEETSMEVDDGARKKQIVRSHVILGDHVRTVEDYRQSSSNSEERDVFLIRYVDEEDDVLSEPKLIRMNPINPKKKKVVIVKSNRDERGSGGQSQREDFHPKKESPYFYYHYDTSDSLITSSSLLLLVGSVLLIFCFDRHA